MPKGVAETIEIDGHSFTKLEASFWLNWRDTGLTMPTPEYRFCMSRKWRADFCFPEPMILVECEGGVRNNGGHNRASGYIKDLEKYNYAAELGYTVLRYHEVTLEAIEQVKRVYLEKSKTQRLEKLGKAMKGADWDSLSYMDWV